MMRAALPRTLQGLLLAGALALTAQGALAQVYGPQPITGSGGRHGPEEEGVPPTQVQEKPDKAAAKAYKAGMKSLDKARELEELVSKTTDEDKKNKALEKLGDTYGQALDQFTEVLRNKSDMYDAWNKVGLIHLRLGAYRESIDDYNHALAIKNDLPEAVVNRAQAFLATDRLEDVKSAYMDLFYHDRPLADQLMVSMQAWLTRHRSAAGGVRPADIDAFDKWLSERNGIAKSASSGS